MTDQTAQAGTGRDDIAKKVIFWAGFGVVIVSIIVLAGAVTTYFLAPENARKPEDIRNIAMTVFNTLVPMFGTWVGTVIAFYFARENFESAAKTTRELVGQLGDERLRQIAVKDAWIAVNAIEAVAVAAGQEQTIPFADVKAKLSSKVSRVPVWNANKVVRFVIHESMIYKFLSERAEAAATAAAAAAAANQLAPAAQPAPTLRDFLAFQTGGTTMEAIVSKIAWVAQNATLADAKAKMEGTPDCQDIFVTSTGKSSEPVLGWITNADLAMKSKA